jgi:hypothetical protein
MIIKAFIQVVHSYKVEGRKNIQMCKDALEIRRKDDVKK